MNVIRRSNPAGIDEKVDRIQTQLNKKLSFPDGFNIFDRAYKTEAKDGVRFERHVSNGNYKDVFRSDKTPGHIVFLLADESTVTKGSVNGTLSVFCFADLPEIYPSVAHRADEELHRDLYKVLRYHHITKIAHGFEALRGFNISLQDIQPWHVCRFDLKINYSLIKNC